MAKSAKVPATLVSSLRRVRAQGSARILKSAATRLEKMGLVYVLVGSEYRRTEFGRAVGPVFVIAIPAL